MTDCDNDEHWKAPRPAIHSRTSECIIHLTNSRKRFTKSESLES